MLLNFRFCKKKLTRKWLAKLRRNKPRKCARKQTPLQNCDEPFSCKLATRLLIENFRGKLKPSQIFARKSVPSRICNSYCFLANLRGKYFRRKFCERFASDFYLRRAIARECGCSQNSRNKQFFPCKWRVFCSETGKIKKNMSYKFYFRKGEVADSKNYLTPEMENKIDMIIQEKLQGSGLKF